MNKPRLKFEDLPAALGWLRHRAGMSKQSVELNAGLAKGAVGLYENGKRAPSWDCLSRLLNALGADFADLHNATELLAGRPEGLVRRIGEIIES